MSLVLERIPGDSRYMRKIVRVRKVPNTMSGNLLSLECGHKVYSFGDLGRLN